VIAIDCKAFWSSSRSHRPRLRLSPSPRAGSNSLSPAPSPARLSPRRMLLCLHPPGQSRTAAQHSPPCEPRSLARARSASRVPSPRTRSSVRKRCGFRSIFGTMWAMADTDGQGLFRGFYCEVFENTTQGGRSYERTAKALRGAVVKPWRQRNTTLEH
jgi:hypothetical protein